MQKKRDLTLVMAPSWGTNMPPLGLAYICSHARQSQLSVRMWDMNMELFHSLGEDQRELWSFENHRYWVDPHEFGLIRKTFSRQLADFRDRVLTDESLVVGFSVHAGNRLFTHQLIRGIRLYQGQRKPHIVIGGPLCQVNSQGDFIMPEFLDLVDRIVVGPGEGAVETVVELVRRGHQDDSPLILFNDKPYFEKGVQSLSHLPFPEYERDFPLAQYTESVLPISMSRGCRGRCVFCDGRFFQPGYFERSPEIVVEEIAHHVEHTGIRNFTFNDLAINWNLPALERFCDLILESGLSIFWNGSATIRKNMSRSLLRKMERAGCSARGEAPILGIPGGSIIFGLESGSDRVLKLMNKGYRAEDASRLLRDSYESGITTVINFIVGFPGEKDEDFKESIRFLENNRDYIHRVGTLSLCYVPEFTELREKGHRYGITFPKVDPQYLWYVEGENSVEIRQQRARSLEDVARSLGKMPLATTLNYGRKPDEKVPASR